MRFSLRLAGTVAGLALAAVATTACSSSSGDPVTPMESGTPTATASPAAGTNTDGDWTLESYKLKDNGLGSFGGSARITYTGDDEHATNTFTLTVSKDGTKVGEALGSIADIGPGETKTVQLVSTDDFVKGPYTVKFEKDV